MGRGGRKATFAQAVAAPRSDRPGDAHRKRVGCLVAAHWRQRWGEGRGWSTHVGLARRQRWWLAVCLLRWFGSLLAWADFLPPPAPLPSRHQRALERGCDVEP
mgnify:CR=1 FL=1